MKNNISNHESRKAFFEIPSLSFLNKIVGSTYGLGETVREIDTGSSWNISDEEGAEMCLIRDHIPRWNAFVRKSNHNRLFFFGGSLKQQIVWRDDK